MFRKIGISSARNDEGVTVSFGSRHHMVVTIKEVSYSVEYLSGELVDGSRYLELLSPVPDNHYDPHDRNLKEKILGLALEGAKVLTTSEVTIA